MSNKTEMIYQKLGITLPQVLVIKWTRLGEIFPEVDIMRLVEREFKLSK